MMVSNNFSILLIRSKKGKTFKENPPRVELNKTIVILTKPLEAIQKNIGQHGEHFQCCN